MNYICPVCGELLIKETKSYRCINNHSYDIARQGYVNLLVVQQKHSLNPGDTRQQVLARREFLSSGAYAPIVEMLITAAKKHKAAGPILDVGCGEGYYCTQLAAAIGAELTGIDISKEAVRCAAAKYKTADWLCATASHLPLQDQSVGIITSLFALTIEKEFRRVLKPNGLYFQILAAEDHLLGLKGIIYPELKTKEKDTIPALEGFDLMESIPIRFQFTAEGKMVQNLLSMTPHAHRISKDGAQRLADTHQLTDTVSCVLNIYKAI